MKTKTLHQKTRLLIAALGVATFLSPFAAQSADESSFSEKLAMASVRDYAVDAAERNAQLRSSAMEARWQELQRIVRPDVLVKLSQEFERDFPGSQYSEADRNLQAGARKALSAVREARLSSGALEEASGDAVYRDDLVQALRGDKDAAYRVATMYRNGSNGLSRDMRRNEQWLRIAAELGSSNASWQVAQLYNREGLVGEAAKYEAKATAAGYSIPVRLPTRGMNF